MHRGAILPAAVLAAACGRTALHGGLPSAAAASATGTLTPRVLWIDSVPGSAWRILDKSGAAVRELDPPPRAVAAVTPFGVLFPGVPPSHGPAGAAILPGMSWSPTKVQVTVTADDSMHPGTLLVGFDADGNETLRAQLPDRWDTVRVSPKGRYLLAEAGLGPSGIGSARIAVLDGTNTVASGTFSSAVISTDDGYAAFIGADATGPRVRIVELPSGAASEFPTPPQLGKTPLLAGAAAVPQGAIFEARGEGTMLWFVTKAGVWKPLSLSGRGDQSLLGFTDSEQVAVFADGDSVFTFDLRTGARAMQARWAGAFAGDAVHRLSGETLERWPLDAPSSQPIKRFDPLPIWERTLAGVSVDGNIFATSALWPLDRAPDTLPSDAIHVFDASGADAFTAEPGEVSLDRTGKLLVHRLMQADPRAPSLIFWDVGARSPAPLLGRPKLTFLYK